MAVGQTAAVAQSSPIVCPVDILAFPHRRLKPTQRFVKLTGRPVSVGQAVLGAQRFRMALAVGCPRCPQANHSPADGFVQPALLGIRPFGIRWLFGIHHIARPGDIIYGTVACGGTVAWEVTVARTSPMRVTS